MDFFKLVNFLSVSNGQMALQMDVHFVILLPHGRPFGKQMDLWINGQKWTAEMDRNGHLKWTNGRKWTVLVHLCPFLSICRCSFFVWVMHITLVVDLLLKLCIKIWILSVPFMIWICSSYSRMVLRPT